MSKIPIKELVARTLGISPVAVNEDLEFNSIPEWDSLNHVTLMIALETTYGVEIDEDRMVKLTNVRAIGNFVAAKGNV